MLGSHNTLTYSRPCHWWGWLVKPFYKCQDSTVEEQIRRGCRAFDIRFLYDEKSGNWKSAHGAVELDANPLEAIATVCCNVRRPYIRVLLERGGENDMERFSEECGRLVGKYPDAVFFCGRYKPGWKLLYDFSSGSSGVQEAEETIIQHVGSMSGSLYGKVLPRLWARLHRKLPDGAKSAALPIVLADLI